MAYETHEKYTKISAAEAEKLGNKIGQVVRHGDTADCPYCKKAGRFDIATKGHDFPGDNSIYYSTVWNEWHCEDCEIERVT